MNRRWFLPAALAAILATTALAYWPGTRGGFLLDDFGNIVDNPSMQVKSLAPGVLIRAATSSISGPLDRPLAMVSFALNVYVSGMDSVPMKRTNLAIHLLNGLLVFVLLRLILGVYARERRRPDDPPQHVYDALALAVTAAWLLAPINLTAVLYVVQRMTSLSATFTLAGLVAYVAGRRRLLAGRPRSGAAWLLFTALIATPLATFTKENGVLTLLYAFVIEWVLFDFRRADGRRSPWIGVYFALFLILPGALGTAWQLPKALAPAAWATRSYGLGERLLTEGRVLWNYFAWTLFPDLRHLTLYHDAYPASRGPFSPWTTLPAWLGIAALLGAGVALRRRRPLIGLGLLWFLAGQVLTASFIPLELVFEHREYLPSLGLFLAVFSPLALARPWQRLLAARIGAIAAVVLLYGAALTLRSLDWSNPLIQTALAAREHPASPRATYAYGRQLSLVAALDPDAAPRAQAALEAAARVPGQSTIADSALILLAHSRKQPMRNEWFEDMAHQLARRDPTPQDIGGLNALVTCASRIHDSCNFPPGALTAVFAAGLGHDPGNDNLAAIFGNYLLNGLGQPRAAAGVFRALVLRHPHESVYHFDLGVAEAASGDLAAARRELAALRRLDHFGVNQPWIESLSGLIDRLDTDRTGHDQI